MHSDTRGPRQRDGRQEGQRILVTGSRSWDDVDTIRTVLAAWWVTTGGAGVLVSGGCPRGADRIAETLWARWGGQLERHPAQWARHGRSAGYRRNAAMVAAGAIVCVAFIRDNSPGASHCARLAEAATIPTRRYRSTTGRVDVAELGCPECGEPVTGQPPTTDPGTGTGEFSHRDGSPLCCGRVGRAERGPAMNADTVDTRMSTEGAISSPMVAALEGAWSAIAARHPELPPVVIVLGAGSGNGPSLTLGHFAAMRWRVPEPAAVEQNDEPGGESGPVAGQLWAEGFVGGEGLARGPADVLATLLHEAAHALAHVRAIKDTSRQGRWHNAKFKALAEEVGISVEKDPRIGWSPTTLPAQTREVYAEVIAELGSVLRLHRAVEITGSGPKKPATPPCACGCGRTIRVSKTVLAAGPILCGVCGTAFTPPASDDDSDTGSETEQDR